MLTALFIGSLWLGAGAAFGWGIGRMIHHADAIDQASGSPFEFDHYRHPPQAPADRGSIAALGKQDVSAGLHADLMPTEAARNHG